MARLSWLDEVGAAAIGLVRYAWFLLAFLYLSIKTPWICRDLGQRDFWRQVALQVYFTAVQAIGPVVTLALVVGLFAIVEGVSGLGALSGADSLGRTITVVVLREVAPLLTGIIVIVRSVTAIAAEIGSMRVQREIEALEVMGIPPMRQLVAPRLLGGLLSLFGLSVVFSAAALVGGFAIAQLLVSLPAAVFLGAVFSATSPVDLAAFLTKIVLGGLGVFLIACYQGMDVGTSPTEVPVAVSKAALHALVYLVGLHGAVTVAVFLTGTGSSIFMGVL
ncbi:MAG: ABC transporter permease [Deltaproteobacteria bacterium]|nr:ABC transporter permease [Deltaproteobacteria bacterium]